MAHNLPPVVSGQRINVDEKTYLVNSSKDVETGEITIVLKEEGAINCGDIVACPGAGPKSFGIVASIYDESPREREIVGIRDRDTEKRYGSEEERELKKVQGDSYVPPHRRERKMAEVLFCDKEMRLSSCDWDEVLDTKCALMNRERKPVFKKYNILELRLATDDELLFIYNDSRDRAKINEIKNRAIDTLKSIIEDDDKEEVEKEEKTSATPRMKRSTRVLVARNDPHLSGVPNLSRTIPREEEDIDEFAKRCSQAEETDPGEVTEVNGVMEIDLGDGEDVVMDIELGEDDGIIDVPLEDVKSFKRPVRKNEPVEKYHGPTDPHNNGDTP